MPPKVTKLAAADEAFLKAWDAEIAAEEAEERALKKQVRADSRSARVTARAELAQVSAKLLQLAGTTDAAARKRANDEFARARGTAAAQRKRALAVLTKRAQSNAAEARKASPRRARMGERGRLCPASVDTQARSMPQIRAAFPSGSEPRVSPRVSTPPF